MQATERSLVGSLISEPFRSRSIAAIPNPLAQSAVRSGFNGGDLSSCGSLPVYNNFAAEPLELACITIAQSLSPRRGAADRNRNNCIGVSPPPPQKRRPLWSSREEEAPRKRELRARWGYSSARRSRRRRWCWCRRSSITLPSPPAPGSPLPLSPPFRTLSFVSEAGKPIGW